MTQSQMTYLGLVIPRSKARLLRAERGFVSVLELFAGSGLRAARYLVEGARAHHK